MVLVLAATAALLWLIPAIQNSLPQVLLSGLSHVPISLPTAWILPALLVTLTCAILEKTGHRDSAIGLIALLTVVSVVRMIWQVYPILDTTYSARRSWKDNAESITCVDESNHSWHYGLNYYAGRDLPDCK